MRILVGSPVKREPEILSLFLQSLLMLDTAGLEVDYYFYDDHNVPKSYEMLCEFKSQNGKVKIDRANDVSFLYECNERTHFWLKQNIERVAYFKDCMINYARDHKYDYLFLVDSDVLPHPLTVKHLVNWKENVVFCVYWTRWKDYDQTSKPNVWLQNQYDFYLCHANTLNGEEAKLAEKKSQEFLKMLRIPGLYEVGGGGACTILSQKVLNSAVRFDKIGNIGWLGEDRHFCIRAACAGFTLWADTYLTPYHCYRPSEIPGAMKFLELSKKRTFKSTGNKLTLMMLVRNEEHRYLKQVLESAKNYCDEFVILDDASTDNTVEFCKEILEGKPLFIHSNPTPQFGNEITLRKQLWEMALKTNPDWLLCLDADEIFEEKAQFKIDSLINQPTYDWYGFHLFDMWNENHYRDDQHWNAHNRYWITLIRYQPNFEYRWHETGQHCGRFPFNVDELPGRGDGLRIKHLGWMKEQDRKAKLERYKKDDPGFLIGNAGQYKSILDKNPRLSVWID